MYCVHVPVCVRGMFLSTNVNVEHHRSAFLFAYIAYWQRPLFFSCKFPKPLSQSPSLLSLTRIVSLSLFLPCTGYVFSRCLSVSNHTHTAVPVETIVYKEVPVEIIKYEDVEVEVPVEKIVTKEVS